VVSFMPWLLQLLGRSLHYPLNGWLCGPQTWQRENSLLWPGIKLQFSCL